MFLNTYILIPQIFHDTSRMKFQFAHLNPPESEKRQSTMLSCSLGWKDKCAWICSQRQWSDECAALKLEAAIGDQSMGPDPRLLAIPWWLMDSPCSPGLYQGLCMRDRSWSVGIVSNLRWNKSWLMVGLCAWVGPPPNQHEGVRRGANYRSHQIPNMHNYWRC